MKLKYLLLMLALATGGANADNSTLDAAIGGALGGAAGAAIGNEVGGRNGAILGGALGAAAGSAVTTDNDPRPRYVAPRRNHHYVAPPRDHYYERSRYYDDDRGYHCPPGQAKKGRC